MMAETFVAWNQLGGVAIVSMSNAPCSWSIAQ